jgi:hypothetical protein
VGVFVEVSENETSSGAVPDVEEAENPATGAAGPERTISSILT